MVRRYAQYVRMSLTHACPAHQTPSQLRLAGGWERNRKGARNHSVHESYCNTDGSRSDEVADEVADVDVTQARGDVT